MEEILLNSYYEATFIYNPSYIYFPEEVEDIDELWSNLYMKDIDENEIPKPNKEEFINLITSIFKTKMKDAIIIKRNELLAQTDWTQMVDVNISNKEAYKEYRQLLRDLPENLNIEFGKEIDDYLPKQP